MFVSVNFHGFQRRLTRTDRIEIALAKETRVTDVASILRDRFPALPLSEEGLMVTVNNQLASSDRLLKDKDTVCFIPPIGGG
jgi:molybdopterin converting factor small subunit